MLLSNFDCFEKEVKCCIDENFVYLVYDYILKCSYIFNLLDVCGVVFVIECAGYFFCICNMVCVVVKIFVVECEKLGFFLLNKNIVNLENVKEVE